MKGYFLLLVPFFSLGQTYEKPWLMSLGVNKLIFVDVPKLETDFYMPTFALYRHTQDGFSLGTRMGINNIKPQDTTKEQYIYFGLEIILRYSINKIVPMRNWDPYLEAGAGNMLSSGGSTLHFLLNAGLQYWFSKDLGIQFHNSYRSDFLRQSLAIYQVSLSVSWRFGGKDTDKDGTYDKIDVCPDAAGPPYFRGCPDTDGDGVQDIKDDCPTIKGLPEFLGCPDTDKDNIPDEKDDCPQIAGTKKTNGCPDKDSDGVRDLEDSCPELFGPFENKGCPWSDADLDGIPDYLDECPQIKGSVVKNGCPEDFSEKTQKQLNDYAKVILFETGTAEIKEESREIIFAISGILKDFPNVKFQVEGHTDNTGSPKTNQLISEERARAVREQLINLGIPSHNLIPIGFGEMRPIATNKTDSGRSQNRRVEINLIR